MINLVRNPPFPGNYAREFVEFDHGKGVYLVDRDGNRYLDLGAGIAVNALGYGRRDLARIASRQMKKLVHVSNLYTTRPAQDLASPLLSLANDVVGKYAAVQFGNSGSEANEAAIKYARLYSHRTRGPGHHRILSFSNGFHGRTMGALSATPTPAYREPFEPLIPGMEVAEFNDPSALESLLTEDFAGVIVEVVQGEGGLRVMDAGFAQTLNRICRERDVLLIADEIQTGLGRTGYLFASEKVGLEPDIICLSKPLAGGLPLAATLIPERIDALLKPGEHGTTFGGGPVTCAVAGRVVRIVSDPAFLDQVRLKGDMLSKRLEALAGELDAVVERRGMGLLQGLVIRDDDPAARIGRIMQTCRDQGVLLLRSSSNVVRIAPPLTISEAEIDRGLEVVRAALVATNGGENE